MGLIAWAKKKAYSAGKTLAGWGKTALSKTADVIDWVGNKVSTIVDVSDYTDRCSTSLRTGADWLGKKQEKWERKEKLWSDVDKYEGGEKEVPTTTKYTPPTPDVKVIESSADCLRRKLGKNIGKTMASKTVDERIETIKEITREISQIYNVDVKDVNFFPSTSEEELCTLGFYKRDKKNINLNFNWVYSDDAEVQKRIVLCICHELYHARQWEAVTLKKDYGYSDEQLGIWLYNFQNYIPAEEDDWGYRHQQLEAMAFGIVDEIESKL